MPAKSGQGLLAIEVELRAEKAAALRRVAFRLDKLLGEMQALHDAAAPLGSPERARQKARHEELRAEAQKQLWYLIVQREALGLRNHDDVNEIYRLPPKLV
jgi:hypothetical protein